MFLPGALKIFTKARIGGSTEKFKTQLVCFTQMASQNLGNFKNFEEALPQYYSN